MISPVLRKEMRDQRPFIWVGLVLLAIESADALMRQTDLHPLGSLFGEIGDESAIFQVLVAFAMGTGLLMREIDEKTLDFLEGLPLTRQRLFITKLSVALGILLIYPIGRIALFAGQHLLSRDSLNRPFHMNLLAVGLAMTAIVSFVGLALGLLLGFLRSLAWMTLGLCVVGLGAGTERWPRLSALNPIELMTIRLTGNRWRVPVENLALQIGLGIAFAVAATLVFAATGHRRGRSLDNLLRRPLASTVVGAVTIGVGFWAVDLYTRESPEDAEERLRLESPDTVQLPEEPNAHSVTMHYAFTYRANHSERLRVVLESADQTYERVESLLRYDTAPSIDVDLTGTSPNTAGTSVLNRIRMTPDGDRLLATLAHETTHVFGIRLAGGERNREMEKLGAFNEGLARWVELQVYEDESAKNDDIFQAAVVSRRHLVSPVMLTDLERLARVNDGNLQYPLGEILVDVFIHRYGGDAPRRLLATLARPDFPRDLVGFELWQAAFQLAGFDLALTLDDYSARLKVWERQYASAIDRLPRPRGVLVRRDNLVGVQVRLDNPMPTGWKTVVRFRPTDDTPSTAYVTRWTAKGVAWQSRMKLANDEMCFQPGLQLGEVALYEAWTCLPLASASPLQ